jgi:hypothetical protein
MRSSTFGESLNGPRGCINVTIPGDSGILATEIRGHCERHLDGESMETGII